MVRIGGAQAKDLRPTPAVTITACGQLAPGSAEWAAVDAELAARRKAAAAKPAAAAAPLKAAAPAAPKRAAVQG